MVDRKQQAEEKRNRIPKDWNPMVGAEGFEPPNRCCRLHAFQACLFSHSSITPFARALLAMRNCRCATNASAKIVKFCLIVAKFS